ncbi:unnamed protein product [Rhizoctonia solani]|uniref:Uncharacterized protein n=1 Tax=Rhizoctonia solani TaxID=456999 RepID=A0A8H3BZ87_9AGAM|nr:unnamed protein product [Rhizoctonia solani]CAE6469814.1 unnamed protein product [Rhizoctonia solani]
MPQPKKSKKSGPKPSGSNSNTGCRFTWEDIEHHRYGIGYEFDKLWDGKFPTTTDQHLDELNNLMLRMSINSSRHVIKFVRPKILPRFEISLFVAMA